jgi:hypothetical protein
MGRALGFEADMIVLAWVIWRVSGSDDWGIGKAETERRKREMQAVPRDFVATSSKNVVQVVHV